MTRRKFTPKFKTKVVLEALKEQHSLAELAQKYEIHPTQISAWKRDFLDGAEQVFESGKKDACSEAEREKDKLLKAIGQLKVENDFLKDALR
ncbi:transposase [Cytophaga sp. FL35]|uniref:transposase n=1 Tax=Cytophaga sp. FL35 TaxID=1904456 RepID=UPI001653D250|nr:transposase [Cytophaga sp. FL35]MBC7000726.1 transposase [Cytophaga sp. FL35]